jgi:methylase of polypeptide subunit release factors
MNESAGWASRKAGPRHAHVQSELVPGRDDALSLIASLAVASPSPRPSFLDLGSGTGDVTAEILKRLPEASVTMIDLAGMAIGG